MSGKMTGVGGIILGAVIAVFAVVTQQYYLLFSAALMIAGGAYSLTFEPESNSQDNSRNAELKMATTLVGAPIPVVFGEVRLAPNYIRYDQDTYKIVEITEKPSGGKGGGEAEDQIVGYKYQLKWEAGICMGPVDQVGMVYGMPGEIEMLPSDTWTTFTGDYVDINLSGTDDQEGAIRVYKGSSSQTRVSSGDSYAAEGMNYRNVCWAMFGIGGRFTYGRSPSVPTYQFVIRRIPQCIRDDSSTVTEIETRASDTLLDPEYHQANPAAIIYEIITNKVWGRGLSSTIIDEDSFALCSVFFKTKKIGMSFALDKAESISDVLEGIRRHLKTILTWDGEKYKLRCLMDVGQTHQYIQTLKQDEISDLTVNRPMWENTINEVRAEFSSQSRAYRPDVVHLQDIANKEAVNGRVSPTRIQFSGFSLFNLTLQQAQRVLSEMSYPYMTATWEMNRYKSHIEVGDVVRVVWNEFGDNITTTYWMIVSIEDGASDDENIKITAIEDQLLSPVDGEELSIDQVPGYYPWERWQETDEGEVTLDEPPQPPTDPISPVHVFEMPAIATAMQNSRTMITGQRPSGSCISVEHVYSEDGLAFTFAGTFPTFSKTGTLVDRIPSGSYWDRSAAGFNIDLTDTEDLADFLAVNNVNTPEDDLEVIVQSLSNFMLIQDEIIGVGIFEQVDSDTVKVRNIVRGMFGTPIRDHPPGENIFFFDERRDGVVTSLLERGIEYYWRGHPISRYGTFTGSPTSVQLKPDPEYKGLGQRPLAPEPFSILDGATMTIKVRPMYAVNGAGSTRFFEIMPTPLDNQPQSFFVEQINASGAVVDPPTVYASFWENPTLDDQTKGVVSLTVPKFSGAKTIRVYSAFGGLRSVRYAQFNVS